MKMVERGQPEIQRSGTTRYAKPASENHRLNDSFRVHAVIGVDLGGSRGERPPIIEFGGQRYPFSPPKIQVRIFENIETTSETKTKNLTTTRNTTMKIVISIIYTR